MNLDQGLNREVQTCISFLKMFAPLPQATLTQLSALNATVDIRIRSQLLLLVKMVQIWRNKFDQL